MTVSDAAKLCDVSYSKIYTICRENNLGGDGKRNLSESDVGVIREILSAKKKKPEEQLEEIRAMLEEVMAILRRTK
jgi:DNA-binding transcriptional MerR regulator